MARLDELAQGIAAVLRAAPAPEPAPLPVDLVNETPAAAAVLVRAVIDSCSRLAAPLSQIVLDPVLAKALLSEHVNGYEGVRIFTDDRLSNRIEFYRFLQPRGTPAPATSRVKARRRPQQVAGRTAQRRLHLLDASVRRCRRRTLSTSTRASGW